MTATEEYTREAVYASLPRTTRGLPLVLSANAAGDKIVYYNGNSVFIRSVKDPQECEIYTEHSTLTTVAKFSPSGFYIASGDNSGKVRIWDTTQCTHILKAEYAVIGGPIRDIAWSEDSKRLAVVGEGRERFGHVFLFDTGTSNGNLSGQSRSMVSIDFRPARPFRLVSASEDNTVALFEGPPFKFKTLFHEHTRFVHCVRYNSTGTAFASAGADGKVVLSEGVEGEKTGELVDAACKDNKAHDGGVFGLCWSPDDQFIATASGDKSIKIWQVASMQLHKTIRLENQIENQQLSVIWTKCGLYSVSLAGFIHRIDIETGSIASTLKGHNKPLTALTISADKLTAFSADSEGHITRWCLADGSSERITPPVHKSQITGLSVSRKGQLVSVGWDDSISFTPNVFEAIDAVHGDKVKLDSQPRGVSMSTDGTTVAVACHKAVLLFVNNKQTAKLDIKYEATCVALSADGKLVAVGGQNNKLHIYEVEGSALSLKKELIHSGALTSVAWSPDGTHLVATDAARRVVPYLVQAEFAPASDKEWTFHTARVNCCAWSEDGRFVASGGLDTNIIVWDMKHTGEHPVIIRGAHSMSPINSVAWVGDRKLLSAGHDSVLKLWTVHV